MQAQSLIVQTGNPRPMTEQGPQDRTKDKKPLKHTLLQQQHKD